MKTMKIEKQMLFADTVRKLSTLNVSDGLQYRQEEDGIRAIGPLFISGEYEDQDGGMQSFQEVLDMDIMAPKHKLSGEDFQIQIEDYHGVPEKEGIHLYITMSIHGLLEEPNDVHGEVSKKQIDTMKEEKAALNLTQEIPPMPTHAAPLRPTSDLSEDAVEASEIPSSVVMQQDEESVKEINQDTFDEFEDLFEDAGTTYTSYRMVVAKPNDTYASIAQRYEVDEAGLRASNHDKEISDKTLVILP